MLARSLRRNSSCWMLWSWAGNQWPGQTLFGARAVLGPEQTRQFGNLFGPSQLLQDAMQPLKMVAVSAQNQRWGFGAQMSEPAEDMWITA